MKDGDGGLPEAMLKALAADLPIFEQHGMSLTSAGDGRAVIRAVAEKGMVNAQGMVHGGLAYVMADTASAYALRSIGPPGVTQNASITYLKGAKPGMELEAEAQVVTAGARMVSLRAEVRSGESLIAHGMFNFARLSR
ncbi:MAG: PaaI family thioesterase [Gammaproteobacteria bacterium]|nr:PaaI family thioesterase [Gammaproteobacteria bacterium]